LLVREFASKQWPVWKLLKMIIAYIAGRNEQTVKRAGSRKTAAGKKPTEKAGGKTPPEKTVRIAKAAKKPTKRRRTPSSSDAEDDSDSSSSGNTLSSATSSSEQEEQSDSLRYYTRFRKEKRHTKFHYIVQNKQTIYSRTR